MPAPPDAAALPVLDAEAGDDLLAAIAEAATAIREMDQARGMSDKAFGEAAEFAGDWIDRRDRLIEEAHAAIAAEAARRGAIGDAYRSSYDRPDAFSVEVAVPIGGRPGVVVHAHCEPGGAPKTGNACHVKLFKYRFDPGGIQLSGTLRTALLHPAAANLKVAQDKGLR